MRLIFVLVLLSNVAFGQSKKKQIESLNLKVDSLNYVLEIERKLYKESKHKLLKKTEIKDLKIARLSDSLKNAKIIISKKELQISKIEQKLIYSENKPLDYENKIMLNEIKKMNFILIPNNSEYNYIRTKSGKELSSINYIFTEKDLVSNELAADYASINIIDLDDTKIVNFTYGMGQNAFDEIYLFNKSSYFDNEIFTLSKYVYTNASHYGSSLDLKINKNIVFNKDKQFEHEH